MGAALRKSGKYVFARRWLHCRGNLTAAINFIIDHREKIYSPNYILAKHAVFGT